MNRFEEKYKEDGVVYAEAMKTAEKSLARAKEMYAHVKTVIAERNWRDGIVAPYVDEMLESAGITEACTVRQANGDDTVANVYFIDDRGGERVLTVIKQTDENDDIRICYKDAASNSIRFLPEEPSELGDEILNDISYASNEEADEDDSRFAVPEFGEPDVEAFGWRRFYTLGRPFFETAMKVDGERLYISFKADNLMKNGTCLEARPGAVRELFISTVPLTKFRHGNEYHCTKKQLQTIAWTIIGVWNDNIDKPGMSREWNRAE